MRILMAGASGFLGNRLIAGPLRGHEIVRLVRRAPKGPDEIRWTPAGGQLDPAALDGVDAVINLSGANIGDQRWTPAYRRLLRDSRVEPTRTLAEAIAKHPEKPKTFISSSGINVYGDTGDRVVDESAAPGEGFFPDLCRVWEASTRPAEEAGVRVVLLRSGVPLEKNEGFLKPQMLPFRLGIGGPIAGGRQWVPWISLDDWLRAVGFLLTERTDIAGPVNVSAPVPVTNAEFTRAFGAALHRPAFLPIPEFGVRLVVGGVAELAVMSTRAVPGVLQRAGFPFRHTEVRSALADALRDQ
ncbi:TIGR01777 family oxidoreductase [Asanoa siamensis]|uniref:TIGR01777 family protein n=1 Tax=Asanoa siamensis TaxID=926357 RepID=A0ABQ4CKD9_9ACTN|nr:TIGR01777 family oxidoreductase [Asanoa siamensis]GIF71751.1 hypothetical protein Asi02nite_12690 [Asanoa siamensis]